jgi:hypothetical protein
MKRFARESAAESEGLLALPERDPEVGDPTTRSPFTLLSAYLIT